MPEPTTINAGSVLLRPFAPSDAAAVYDACQDPLIPRWTTVPSPYGHRDADTYVQQLAPAVWDRGGGCWAVCDAVGGALLGSVSVDRPGPRRGELGYWTAQAARGRGVMTTAARAACRWAFDAAELTRIEWLAAVGNEPSWRVAHQVGFRYEGRLRARLSHADGAVDAWAGALLPGEVASSRVPLPFGADPQLVDGAGGDLVGLRRWGEQDLGAYAALRGEPEVARWGGQAPGLALAQAREQLLVEAVEGWLTGAVARLAITREGVPVGGVGLYRGHGGGLEERAECSWWLGQAARGQGVASRAVRLLADWAATLGVGQLHARVAVTNAGSRRLAIRCGFREEGVLRAGVPDHAAGGLVDAVLYGRPTG